MKKSIIILGMITLLAVPSIVMAELPTITVLINDSPWFERTLRRAEEFLVSLGYIT